MLSDNKVIDFFYMADDFCIFFNETVKKHSIEDGKKHRNKPSHNQRIHCHKVFKGIAMRGQCSMGWFFGFKLHRQHHRSISGILFLSEETFNQS